MDCRQIDQYLDAMLDGTLDEDELNTVEAHCQGCAACAEKPKANRMMMRVFAEMAPEMDVPLEAQAAWRGAVKREAGIAGRRRFFRYAGGIAAALVVVLGTVFALRAPAKQNAPMYASDAAAEFATSEEALIEADGAAESFEGFADDAGAGAAVNMMSKAAAAPMHEIEMRVDDVERVCDYARDLAEEYEGTIEIQRFDEDGVPCANLFVDLSAANAGEFIEAMRHFDQSGAEQEDLTFEGETSLLLVLKSK